MHDRTSLHLRRAREVVLGLCAAWLVLQNLILFAVLAWFPVADLATAALVIVRVALRAATPLTLAPGATLLDVAGALLAAGAEVHHG